MDTYIDGHGPMRQVRPVADYSIEPMVAKATLGHNNSNNRSFLTLHSISNYEINSIKSDL